MKVLLLAVVVALVCEVAQSFTVFSKRFNHRTALRSTQTAPTGGDMKPWDPTQMLKQLEQHLLSPVIDAMTDKFIFFSDNMLHEQEYTYDKDTYEALNEEVKHLKEKAEDIEFWREFENEWDRRYAEQNKDNK